MGILQPNENEHYTVEEYFQFLESSDQKLEYHKGLITMMAGAKLNHNRIKDDVGGYVWSRLKSCRSFSSDQAVSTPKGDSYYFPDLVYTCEENDITKDNDELILLNPSVIIEVLSRSTTAKDRGEKFTAYWQIETLKEYILIDSQSTRVDVFHRKGDAEWIMRSFYRMDQEVVVETLGIKIPMLVIYGRVSFPDLP